MKAVLALAASLSIASASILPRQLDQIPQCALSCALASLQSTGCPATDFGCICRAEAFITGLVPCVQEGCSAAEFDATAQAAVGLCSAAGVTLSIPTGAPETTSASMSAPSSAPSSVSTEAEESTTAPPTTTGMTEMMTSTGMTEMMTSSTGAPATRPANGTETGTRPPNPTGTEPGAAGRNTVTLGGLGAIVALVAAFL